MPTGRIWTAKDDSVMLPAWLGIPVIRHSIGLARWWHLSETLPWMINGIAYFVLLFTSGQWLRLVPTSWDVVFITDARVNLSMLWARVHDNSWSGFAIFFSAIMLMAVAWWWASPFTLRHARLVQRIGELPSRPFGVATQSWDA